MKKRLTADQAAKFPDKKDLLADHGNKEGVETSSSYSKLKISIGNRRPLSSGKENAGCDKLNVTKRAASSFSAKSPLKRQKSEHEAPSQVQPNTKPLESLAPRPRTPLPPPVLRDPFEGRHREKLQIKALGALKKMGPTKRGSNSGSTGSSIVSSFGGVLADVHDLSQSPAPFKLERRLLSQAAAAAALRGREVMHLSVRGGSGGCGDTINLGGAGTFSVSKFLGGGTYGSVFELKPRGSQRQSAMAPVALKVELGVRHLPWELHILRCGRARSSRKRQHCHLFLLVLPSLAS